MNPIAATDQERDAVAMLRRGMSREDVMDEFDVDDEWLDEAIESVKGTVAQPKPTPLTVAPQPDALARMLSAADDSTSKAAQRTAGKIRLLIATLREQLQQVEEDDRKAAAVAAERERVHAEIVAAREALAAANAKMRALTGKTATGPKPLKEPTKRGDWVENHDGTWTSPAGRRYSSEQKAAMVTRMLHAQTMRKGGAA